MRTRVAITGVGTVSALGLDANTLFSALVAGVHGVAPIQARHQQSAVSGLAAAIQCFDPLAHFEPTQLTLLDRFSQLALVAGREALRQAGWTAGECASETTGIVCGCSGGGVATEDDGFRALYSEGRTRVSPLSIPRIMSNAAASALSLELGCRGPSLTLSTACSSSAHAIAQAALMVRHGVLDRVLVGGSEAPFGYGHLKAWEALRVMAPDACRPFCRYRQGMVLGEAGAMLTLESWEVARARGSRILGEVAGFGMGSSAHHLTQPDIAGTERVVRAALLDAGIEPASVAHVNAHGTGTRANDALEAQALRQALREHADSVPVSATKGAHGHALGAAGALEFVELVLALDRQLAPPTLNVIEVDPECPIDVVVGQPRPLCGEYGLSVSLAFGGSNVVLVARRAE